MAHKETSVVEKASQLDVGDTMMRLFTDELTAKAGFYFARKVFPGVVQHADYVTDLFGLGPLANNPDIIRRHAELRSTRFHDFGSQAEITPSTQRPKLNILLGEVALYTSVAKTRGVSPENLKAQKLRMVRLLSSKEIDVTFNVLPDGEAGRSPWEDFVVLETSASDSAYYTYDTDGRTQLADAQTYEQIQSVRDNLLQSAYTPEHSLTMLRYSD